MVFVLSETFLFYIFQVVFKNIVDEFLTFTSTIVVFGCLGT